MKMNIHAMIAVVRGAGKVIDPAFTYKGVTEEWHYYIDLTTLDMSDSFNCILAQLAPLLLHKTPEGGSQEKTHIGNEGTPFGLLVEELEAKRDWDDLVPWHATEFHNDVRVLWTQYFGFDQWSGKYTSSDLTETWRYYIEGRREEAA